MTTYEARWLAGYAAEAALAVATEVDALMEDAEAAEAAGDAATVAECASMALEALARCEAILNGSALPSEAEGVVVEAIISPAIGPDLDALPSPPLADSASMATCRQVMSVHYERFRSRLPLDVPSMRAPEEFFAFVRTMRELEALRAHVGLAPLDWELP